MLNALAFITFIVLISADVVWGLTRLGADVSSKPPAYEINFRNTCDRLHGTTVWNGKSLECLK